MILKRLNILLLIFLLIFTISCEVFEPKDYIPAYISVDEVDVQTLVEEGSDSHCITDCWVYVDNKLVGVFEVPFTIPVLDIGDKNIKIEPGIKNNGVDAQRVIYPMMYDYNIDTLLIEKEILKIKPVFKYRPDKIHILEDFDAAGTIFEKSEESDTIISFVDDTNSFEGRSMAIFLDEQRSVFECKTSELYELPKNVPVYLEIDYKNTDPFVFGFFVKEYSGGGMIEKRVPIYVFNPNPDSWKKTYIELNYHIANAINSMGEYRFFITCVRGEDVSSTNTQVFIDNFKILY